MLPLLLTCCNVYSSSLQITVRMPPAWEIWCCNLNFAHIDDVSCWHGGQYSFLGREIIQHVLCLSYYGVNHQQWYLTVWYPVYRWPGPILERSDASLWYWFVLTCCLYVCSVDITRSSSILLNSLSAWYSFTWKPLLVFQATMDCSLFVISFLTLLRHWIIVL